MNERPNLFKYATKELSQDAFICWLLEWANSISIDSDSSEDDKLLHDCAVKLLKEFFKESCIIPPDKIETIRIERQFEKIDSLVIINEKIVSEVRIIIIEDKTDSNEHSGQLLNYKNKILSSHNNKLPETFRKLADRSKYLLAIYFKTGDQLNFKEVQDAGYKPFLREHFLTIINQFDIIKNNIFVDYKKNLNAKEIRYRKFNEVVFTEWEVPEWQGFVTNMFSAKEGQGLSGYGSSKGFYWNSIQIETGVYFYLRINFNTRKLVFKLEFAKNSNEQNPQEIKKRLFKIMEQNKRFKIEYSTTVLKKQSVIATIKEEWPVIEDKINLDEAKIFIQSVEQFYTHIIEEYTRKKNIDSK